MKSAGAGKPRIRARLLVLLWIWAACVFVVVDLFLNVDEFDAVRPRAPLYQAMRQTAHEMVGEPCLDAGAFVQETPSPRQFAATDEIGHTVAETVLSADEIRARLRNGTSLSSTDLHDVLDQIQRFPDPALASELLELSKKPDALVQRGHADLALALAAIAVRLDETVTTTDVSSGSRDDVRGRVVSAALNLQVEVLGREQGGMRELEWSNARLTVERLATAVDDLIGRDEYAGQIGAIRSAIGAEISGLAEGSRPYRAGIHGLRLAYVLGDQATAGVLLEALRHLERARRVLDAEGMRQLVDFASRTVIEHGSVDQRCQLRDLLVKELQAEADPLLRERFQRYLPQLPALAAMGR